MPRPVTSKSRGVCLYYNAPRGCFAGDKCKFLHGGQELLTPYDKAKRCRFYAQGFCKRGDACWFIHATEPVQEDDDDLCSICFEKPTLYGLLGGCSHIFCTTCIKQWRDPANKPCGVLDSGNTKKCPMCRAPSRFITPSSRFWKEGTEDKNKVVQAYKESMARVPCRYFQKSLQRNKDKPLCPYGKDCFYQHLNADGTPHIFKDGVDNSMRRYRHSTHPGITLFSEALNFNSPFASLVGPITMPFPTLRNAPRRDRDRHILDEYMRLQPALPPDPITQPETQATLRLREVRRSLDMLHEAIIEEGGTSLGSLNDAVVALRAGLAGAVLVPDDDNGAAGGDRALAPEDVEALRQEDEVMERLEDLMLASIAALQQGSRTSSPSHSDDEDMPSLERIPNSDSEDDGDDDDDSDGSSMPALQSVSNTSGSEVSDDDDDDDNDMLWDLALLSEGIAESGDGDRVELLDVWPWGRQRGAAGGEASANGNNNGTDTTTTTNNNNRRPRRSGAPQSQSGHANRNRNPTSTLEAPSNTTTTLTTATTTTTPNSSASTSTRPVSTTSSSSSPCPVPPTLIIDDVDSASPSADITGTGTSIPEPPYITDGRGRVVWTSSSSEASFEEGSSSAAVARNPKKSSGAGTPDAHLDSSTTLIGSDDVTGRESVVPLGADVIDDEGVNDSDAGHSDGGGTTLFDWFSSLF